MNTFKRTFPYQNHNLAIKNVERYSELVRAKFLKKPDLKNKSTIALTLSLAACNGSTTPIDPCSDANGVSEFICVDSELSSSSQDATSSTIQMSSNQLPVYGTTEADTFVATSGFLTSRTVIDGGSGNDTLSLNLKGSVKNSPTIKNIENVSLTSYGDHSLNLGKVTELEYILSQQSLGKITLNNLTDASTVFGFSGNGINSTILTSNDLGGSSDVLKLHLVEASNVSFQAPLGYEEIEIELSGSSSLSYLLTNGVSAASVSGNGDLVINLDFKDLNSFSSNSLNGGLIGKSLDSDGFSQNGVIGSKLGTALELGASADNIYFLDKAESSALNTIELGPGDDKIAFDLSTNSRNSILGESGNDQIKFLGKKITANEIIDGGDGIDTVIIEQAQNNLFNFLDIEKLILKNIASGNNTFSTIDGPISVTLESGRNGSPSNFSILELPSFSNITVSNSPGETSGLGEFSATFQNFEVNNVINIETSKSLGDFYTKNIGLLTLNFKDQTNMSNHDFKFDNTTKLVINAEKAFSGRDFVGDISTELNKLKELSIIGKDTISLGSMINMSEMETANIESSGNLSLKNIGSGALSNLSLNSETGNLNISAIDLSNDNGAATIILLPKVL